MKHRPGWALIVFLLLLCNCFWETSLPEFPESSAVSERAMKRFLKTVARKTRWTFTHQQDSQWQSMEGKILAQVDRYPQSDAVLTLLGKVYYNFGKNGDHIYEDTDRLFTCSKEALQKAVAINPNNVDALFALAHSLSWGRYPDYEESIKLFEKGLSQAASLDADDRMKHLYRYAYGLRQLGRFDQARNVLESVLAEAERTHDEYHTITAKRKLGDLYLKAGSMGQAEQYLVEAFNEAKQSKSLKNSGCPYQSLGELYKRIGKYDMAVKMYQEVADRDSDMENKQFFAALMSFSVGDNDQALRFIERALCFDARSEYLNLKGLILLTQQEYDFARALFERAGEMKTADDDGASVGLGHWHLIRKEPEKARSLLSRASEASRTMRDLYEPRIDALEMYQWLIYKMANLGMAWSYSNQNKHTESLEHYDRILRTTKFDLMALVGKGIALTNLRRLNEAEMHLRVALEKFPDSEYALAEMATLKLARGELKQAEQMFHQALAIDDAHFTCPYEGMGLLLLTQGRVEQAEEHLKKAIEINPDIEYKKFNALAEIYIKKGRFEEAEALLIKSMANFPYDDHAKKLLALVRQMKNAASRRAPDSEGSPPLSSQTDPTPSTTDGNG